MLEVMGLVKRYGDVLALDGCSLNVPSGHLVGLLGPNGAGKTQPCAPSGLVVPDAGTVRWRGVRLTRAQRSCTPAPGCASPKPGGTSRPGRSQPGARKRGLPCREPRR
jgi:ABC-type multidrug transport system ATPase subunit